MKISRRHNHLLRGYYYIKLNSRIQHINRLFYDISQISFMNVGTSSFTPFGLSLSDYSEYIQLRINNLFNYYGSRERLIKWYGRFSANKQAKYIAAIPPEWHSIYHEYGIKVHTYLSLVLWKIILLKYVVIGIVFFLRSLRPVKIPYIYGTYVVSPNIGDKELFENMLDESQKSNIFKLINIQNDTLISIDSYIYDSTVYSVRYNRRFVYVFYCFSEIFISILSLFSDRSDIALSLKDRLSLSIFKSNYSLLLNRGCKILEFLFSVSNLHSRPLYSYYCRNKLDIPSSVFFYSRNNIGFSAYNLFEISSYIWISMKWDFYYLLGQENLKYISKLNSPMLFYSSRSSTFYDIDLATFEARRNNRSLSVSTTNPFVRPTIFLFDVTPRNSSDYTLLLENYEYYFTRNVIDFIKDVLMVFQRAEYDVILFRKKPPIVANNRKYDRQLNLLLNSYKNFYIQNDKSWLHHIQYSSAVISYPFTSTAYYALECSVPSIFYDTTNSIHADSLAKCGLELVRGFDDLRKWSTTLHN